MKTERFLTLIFLIGIVFKIFHWEGEAIIPTVAALTISGLVYAIGGFYFFSDGNLRRQNLALSIVGGLLLSTAPMGILFKLNYWKGTGPILFAGLVSAAIVLATTLVLKRFASADLKRYYKNMVLRAGVLTALSLILYVTPTNSLLKLQYWDEPELGIIKALYYAHPENDEYRRQQDEYWQRKWEREDD